MDGRYTRVYAMFINPGATTHRRDNLNKAANISGHGCRDHDKCMHDATTRAPEEAELVCRMAEQPIHSSCFAKEGSGL